MKFGFIGKIRVPALMLLIAAMATLVAACGSDPTATPVPTATPIDPNKLLEDWEVEYNATLEAARAEGEVVIVMGGSASRNFAPRFQAFEQETGITVVAVTGRGSQQVEKFKAEREAGLFTADIWMTGVTSSNNAREAGIVGPLPEDFFIKPIVADESNWVDGHHWFADQNTRDTIFAFCASPSTQFAVNTDLVDLSTLDSYWDLIDGRFDGMIVGTLPWEPGHTNSDFYINTPDLGEEYIRKIMLDANVEWVADGQQAVDLLANGVKSVFVYQGNANSDIDDLADEGLPVVNHFGQGFAEGGVVSIGGTCAQSVFNDPANENAAKIFFNWWNSPENLHAAQGITDDQSLHASVLSNNLDEKWHRSESFFFPEMDDSIEANAGLRFNQQVAEEAGLR